MERDTFPLSRCVRWPPPSWWFLPFLDAVSRLGSLRPWSRSRATETPGRPLATACATLPLKRSDGAAPLAALVRVPPCESISTSRGARHDSCSSNPGRTTTAREKQYKHRGRRTENSSKTRETAGIPTFTGMT